MKKTIILVCIILNLILLASCEKYSSFYDQGTRGVTVVNNSSKDIKDVSVNKNNSRETGLNADNSYIKNGESIFFDFFKTNKSEFTITITDSNNLKYTSQAFTRDFSYDAVYYIYIVDNENKEIEFKEERQKN